MQKHPLQMRARHFVPPLFVIALFGSLLFAALSPNAMPFFGLITGSYVTVNLAASALTASSTGWRHFFLLPVVFAMIHLSWGLGFLTGLARFWNRWGEARNLPQTLPSMEAIRKP
jgi:hypothetical protein